MNETNDGFPSNAGGSEPHAMTNEDQLLSVPPSFGKKARRVLVGTHGLRSGWRFLVYLAMFGALAFLFVFVTGRVFPQARQKSPPVWVAAMAEFCVMLAAFIPAWVMGRFEHRPFGDYGLPRRGAFGKQFWVGAVWGLVALSVLLFAIRGAGDFALGGLALHGPRILKYAAFWGAVFLIVGFFEEFLFRGYTLFTLTQGMGFWPSALLLSAIFGAVHLGNAGEAWIGALAAGMIGLFFCLTVRRTGALWFAVGFHAAWDWAESYFYSVPDSGSVSPGHLLNSSFHGSRWITGGTVGPEGSVFVLILIVVIWVVFERVYPEAKYGA
jgi:membrane protease YdiL (CAAX protease family)